MLFIACGRDHREVGLSRYQFGVASASRLFVFPAADRECQAYRLQMTFERVPALFICFVVAQTTV